MLGSLLFSALLMGIAGGPHCLAMCGAGCMGISRWPGQSAWRNLWLFQTGRLMGYASLGAVAAVSMNSLTWLAGQTALIHPLWSMMHVTAVLWGLWLVWRAEQPVWINRLGETLWRRLSHHAHTQPHHLWSPLWLGMVWALLPCGLLYSALLVAMFTAGAIQGAMVMAMFALGGALVLTVVPWLWSHWGQRHHTIEWQWNKRVDSKVFVWHTGHLGTRVSGVLLAVTAAWGLWTGLTHASSPWCLPSAWV
jgi:uncharacterized protein